MAAPRFGETENNAIQSADPENPTVEPNMKGIDTPRGDIAIWIFPNESLEVGRRSVLNIYFFLHWSHILLFSMLGT